MVIVSRENFGLRTWSLDWDAPIVGVPTPAPARTPLALAAILWTGRRDPVMRFTLPAPGPARLTLYDVSGRRLASRRFGRLGAGSHELPLEEARALGSGIYFLRLEQGGRAACAKVVVAR
jgi:hypothetical protein